MDSFLNFETDCASFSTRFWIFSSLEIFADGLKEREDKGRWHLSSAGFFALAKMESWLLIFSKNLSKCFKKVSTSCAHRDVVALWVSVSDALLLIKVFFGEFFLGIINISRNSWDNVMSSKLASSLFWVDWSEVSGFLNAAVISSSVKHFSELWVDFSSIDFWGGGLQPLGLDWNKILQSVGVLSCTCQDLIEPCRFFNDLSCLLNLDSNWSTLSIISGIEE